MPVAQMLVTRSATRRDPTQAIAPLVALLTLVALLCVAIVLAGHSGTTATSHGRFGPPTVAAPAHSHVAAQIQTVARPEGVFRSGGDR